MLPVDPVLAAIAAKLFEVLMGKVLALNNQQFNLSLEVLNLAFTQDFHYEEPRTVAWANLEITNMGTEPLNISSFHLEIEGNRFDNLIIDEINNPTISPTIVKIKTRMKDQFVFNNINFQIMQPVERPYLLPKQAAAGSIVIPFPTVQNANSIKLLVKISGTKEPVEYDLI